MCYSKPNTKCRHGHIHSTVHPHLSPTATSRHAMMILQPVLTLVAIVNNSTGIQPVKWSNTRMLFHTCCCRLNTDSQIIFKYYAVFNLMIISAGILAVTGVRWPALYKLMQQFCIIQSPTNMWSIHRRWSIEMTAMNTTMYTVGIQIDVCESLRAKTSKRMEVCVW